MSAGRTAGQTLGLFPALDSIGGVQASGGLAWEGVTGLHRPGGSLLFSYGQDAPESDAAPLSPSVHAPSKPGAILSALRVRGPISHVLVWHVGLLKLLPFFRVGGAKVVLFLHGIEVWRKQDWLTSRVLRRVDLFLSNSEYTWRRFVGVNPDFAGRPHRIVHLGIGSEVSGEVPNPSDPPAMLMTSRLLKSEAYKGHREMIEAWPQVTTQVPGAELWVCGDGDLRSDLERWAVEVGVGRAVRFFGWVSEEEKSGLLARSRCFALPSRGEGFGLVYLEAMRMGRPCLVSKQDAGREVVNPPEAGLAVDLYSSKEIATAACRLLESGSEWEEMRLGARRRYAELFTAGDFQRRLNAALYTP